MTLPKNVAELQGENVVFELECIDRMYLNLYVPQLASAPEGPLREIICAENPNSFFPGVEALPIPQTVVPDF